MKRLVVTTLKYLLVSSLAMAICSARPAEAADQGTDLFIPAVARTPGNNNANFYSTLWITNPNHMAASVDVRFFETNQSNLNPTRFSDVLLGGETKKYDNVLETRFGRTNTSGSLRIVASLPVIASSRTYDLGLGANIRDSKGLFFAGAPTSGSIRLGQRTLLQGVSQGASEDFRYNFGIVETAGSAVSVEAVLLNGAGQRVASKVYQVPAYGRVQFAVSDILSNVSLTNGVVDLGVISGAGAIITFGTQIQNGSNDSSGFEMSYGGLTALSSVTNDHCTSESPGTLVTILGKQFIIVEVVAATPDGREWVIRYPTEYTPNFNVTYRTLLEPTCNELVFGCGFPATSFCGYRAFFNVSGRVTSQYSSYPGSASNVPEVRIDQSVSVYIAISLVGGYEPFSISASYQTTTRQNAVDVGG